MFKYYLMIFLEVVCLSTSVVIYNFVCDKTSVEVLKEFYRNENELIWHSDEIELMVKSSDSMDELIDGYMVIRMNMEFSDTDKSATVSDCDSLTPDSLSLSCSYVRYYVKAYVEFDKIYLARTDSEKVAAYENLILILPMLRNSFQSFLIAYGRELSFICIAIAIFLMVLSLLMWWDERKRSVFVYK